jgi:hypothetical protein
MFPTTGQGSEESRRMTNLSSTTPFRDALDELAKRRGLSGAEELARRAAEHDATYTATTTFMSHVPTPRRAARALTMVSMMKAWIPPSHGTLTKPTSPSSS